MTGAIEKLKKESIKIRRDRGKLASFSVYVLSEIENIGKNSGNRQTTEDEAITVLKKLIDKNKSAIEVIKDTGKIAVLNSEINLLQSILPELASEDDIRVYLLHEFGKEKPANKGVAMKMLKTKFGSLVDMKIAGAIVTEMYGV